jgi:hypothetical protein
VRRDSAFEPLLFADEDVAQMHVGMFMHSQGFAGPFAPPDFRAAIFFCSAAISASS